MRREDFEIMAPVGSWESLAAAFQAGAGSIYFGVEKLNMRSRSASHFTLDDLRDIASQCNAHGVQSYLTLNTVMYGEDIPLVHEIVDAALAAGISAIIACDIAVMTYCNKVGMEVHLSTQHNRAGYTRTERCSYSHRDVLSRSTLYGHKRQVLLEPE